jgi:hypothetical protein
MAVVHLDRAATDAEPWWRDLLNYERAWFLQAATTAEGPPTNRPKRGLSAVCMNFSWNMPEAVQQLKNGAPITEALHRPVTLVFARGRDGKVFVVQVSPEVERVFRATNGLRTVEQIATAAGVRMEQTVGIVKALAGVGAIVASMSPEEMTRMIEAREKQ